MRTTLVLALFLGCPGASHPTPSGTIGPGEKLFTLETRWRQRAVWALDENGNSTQETWDLPLIYNGSRGGGEVWILDDGDRIYCGEAYFPERVVHCWQLHEGVSTPLGPPLLDTSVPSTKFKNMARDFAVDGSWWAVGPNSLRFSPALDQQAVAVPLPFDKGRSLRIDYSPVSQRLAVADRSKQGKLWILTPTGEVVDSLDTDGAWINPMWNPAGTQIALVRHDRGVEVWTPGSPPEVKIPFVVGVGAQPERIELLDWSPDGTRLLINSSRHAPPSKNWFVGVSLTVYETFAVDLQTGIWTRFPALNRQTLWRCP